MQSVKELVFTLCLASLCAGVVLHLFPDAAAKRCMKAVAGLYVLSAVLGVAQGASGALAALDASVQSGSQSAVLSDASADSDAFTQSVLAQAQAQLNAQYSAYLAAQGYDGTVSVALQQTGENVVISGVDIALNVAITAAQSATLTDYFVQNLGVDVVRIAQPDSSA